MSNRDPTQIFTEADKARNFWFLVYPDSAIPNWQEELNQLMIPTVISPLHEPEEGSEREYKPHYHVIFMWTSPRTIRQALEYVKLIGGVPDLRMDYTKFVVGDLRKALRYLCHLDEKGKKPLYDTSAVTILGDIDYDLLIQSSTSDIEMLQDITLYVFDHHVTNFSQFQVWNVNNRKDWFELCARRATFYVLNLIKSERYNVD